MNLRQNPTTGEKPWYHQGASVEETAPQKPLYDTAAAERILARAGALQEVQERMLSPTQIEAIAAEVGIRPEFVRLAIEQEKTNAPILQGQTLYRETGTASECLTRRERLRIADASFGAAALYGLFVYLILRLAGDSFWSLAPVIALVFALPGLLAFVLGMVAKSRRWGAVTGASLGVTVMAGVAASLAAQYGPTMTVSAWDMQALAVMCGSGALLGAAGAQARRIVSKRQRTNRSRRIKRGV